MNGYQQKTSLIKTRYLCFRRNHVFEIILKQVAIFGLFITIAQSPCLAEAEQPIEVPENYSLMTTSIPMQALLSQRAGLCRVIVTASDKAILEVVHSWIGGNGTNIIEVESNDMLLYQPQTNEYGIFFATTNQWWRLVNSSLFATNIFQWAIATNRSETAIATTNWTVINDKCWLIPVVDSDAPLVCLTSNLIHAAWQDRNETLFNSIIREAVCNPWESDVARHARTYVFCNRNFLPSNLVSEAFTKRE